MIDVNDIVKWAGSYKKDAEHVGKAIKYHNVLPDEVLRIEGRIQAINDLLKMIDETSRI